MVASSLEALLLSPAVDPRLELSAVLSLSPLSNVSHTNTRGMRLTAGKGGAGAHQRMRAPAAPRGAPDPGRQPAPQAECCHFPRSPLISLMC